MKKKAIIPILLQVCLNLFCEICFYTFLKKNLSNQFHEKKLFPDIEELVPAENSDVSRSRYGSDSTKNCSRDCRERVGAGRYRCDSEVCILHEMEIFFFFFEIL